MNIQEKFKFLLAKKYPKAENLNQALKEALPRLENSLPLHIWYFDSPLGLLLSLAGPKGLGYLKFISPALIEEKAWQRLIKNHENNLVVEANGWQQQLENELEQYFLGKRQNFSVPTEVLGTKFQKSAWQALGKIPYGKTKSYQEQACAINHPRAYRAVALANKNNPLVIIYPCHRVLPKNGSLGGYACGPSIKAKLLKLEKGEK